MNNQSVGKMIKGTIKVCKLIYNTDKLAVVLHFPGSIIRAVQPYLALFITGYLLNGFVSGIDFTHLLRVAIGYMAVRFLLDRLGAYTDKILQVHNDIAVRKMYLNKAYKYMEIDFQLLDSPTINEINERIRRDTHWGSGLYGMHYCLKNFLDSTFGLLTGLIMMIPLFIRSGVAGVALLLSGLFLFSILSSLINHKFFQGTIAKLLNSSGGNPGEPRERGAGVRDYFVYYNDIMPLFKTVRIYKFAPLFKTYAEVDIKNNNAFAKKFTQFTIGSAFVSTLSSGVLLIGAYLFVVARAVIGVIPVGDVVFFAGTIHQMSTQFFSFVASGSWFVDQTNRVQSMLEFMELENQQYQGTLPVEKRRDGEYEVEFNDVSFKYPGNESYALRNFNLKLAIGQKLAIVGMNGSGKTTMIKLLCRLYDPTEGVITLNGIDIKKYDYREYMSIFSVVFQDFKVFSFTLAENLACNTGYDPAQANLAIERVGMTKRVADMPKGLDTHIYNNYDEGIEVSGGESQKIALARALYKNAPFIVLDEPTAALDPIAEFEIYSMFNDVVQDKTAIFISHRLSSCRFCDDIAVFHEGEFIQRGSHDELLADKHGKYHELWNAQAQYYNDAG